MSISDERLAALLRAAAAQEEQQPEPRADVEAEYRKVLERFRQRRPAPEDTAIDGTETNLEAETTAGSLTDQGGTTEFEGRSPLLDYAAQTFLSAPAPPPWWGGTTAYLWRRPDGIRSVTINGSPEEWSFKAEALRAADDTPRPSDAVGTRPARGSEDDPAVLVLPKGDRRSAFVALHVFKGGLPLGIVRLVAQPVGPLAPVV